MKKLFPYFLIICVCYLIVSFIKSDMNTFNWESSERVCLVFLFSILCFFYRVMTFDEKDN